MATYGEAPRTSLAVCAMAFVTSSAPPTTAARRGDAEPHTHINPPLNCVAEPSVSDSITDCRVSVRGLLQCEISIRLISPRRGHFSPYTHEARPCRGSAAHPITVISTVKRHSHSVPLPIFAFCPLRRGLTRAPTKSSASSNLGITANLIKPVSARMCRAPQECAGPRCLNSAEWRFTK